ncbi:hypothetical protein [Dethiothermospora halolimnae]|uniref:hypothetical protein n=1 Tax=Dethiothermospora halolimnae TaxID=3114390 RepID=UPI003CCBECE0
MGNVNEMLDIMIQQKFEKVLNARRQGELYDFKKDLKDELESRESEIKELYPGQWDKVEDLLSEIKKVNTITLN